MPSALPPADAELDAIGLLCPLPVLRARKRLMQMRPGEVLRVLASDPMAQLDLPNFCRQSGHEFVGCENYAGHAAYLIRCGAPTGSG